MEIRMERDPFRDTGQLRTRSAQTLHFEKLPNTLEKESRPEFSLCQFLQTQPLARPKKGRRRRNRSRRGAAADFGLEEACDEEDRSFEAAAPSSAAAQTYKRSHTHNCRMGGAAPPTLSPKGTLVVGRAPCDVDERQSSTMVPLAVDITTIHDPCQWELRQQCSASLNTQYERQL